MHARTAIAVVLALAILAPAALSGSVSQRRIVMPYGVDERHVPVIAGYEVLPRPVPCGVGEPLPTEVLLARDFDAASAMAMSPPVHVIDIARDFSNHFHVTTFAGKGTDDGHSGPGRLHFGRETYSSTGAPLGSYKEDGRRVAGVASLPALVVPDAPTFLSWSEKFEVEALLGYDHMWIEAREPATGEVYILCSSDVESRPDSSSNESTTSVCSPWRVGVCPTGVKGGFGTDYVVEYLDLNALPTEALDPGAPHWHHRFVEIPAYFAGRAIEIRFSFDTADPTSNVHMGWMVDDALVFTGAVDEEPLYYVPRGAV